MAPLLSPTYPIETDRLTLRPMDPVSDVDAIYAYQSRYDVSRYVPFEPRSREEVAQRLSHPERVLKELTAPGQTLNLAIVLTEVGTLIGDVQLSWTDATNGELGYVIHPDYQGQGIATEACRPMLRLAFDGLGLHRVTARIEQRNLASAAVLVKLGFRREAVLVENEWFKGEWSTEEDFAILAREWRAIEERLNC